MKSMHHTKKYIIHKFVCLYQTSVHPLYILLFGPGCLQFLP